MWAVKFKPHNIGSARVLMRNTDTPPLFTSTVCVFDGVFVAKTVPAVQVVAAARMYPEARELAQHNTPARNAAGGRPSATHKKALRIDLWRLLICQTAAYDVTAWSKQQRRDSDSRDAIPTSSG